LFGEAIHEAEGKIIDLRLRRVFCGANTIVEQRWKGKRQSLLITPKQIRARPFVLSSGKGKTRNLLPGFGGFEREVCKFTYLPTTRFIHLCRPISRNKTKKKRETAHNSFRCALLLNLPVDIGKVRLSIIGCQHDRRKVERPPP